MYHDVRNFRDFLKTLAEQGWVKEIVIVSHSLGARLVIPAVSYVDRTSSSADSSNISNIILASPDIDRETFERDIEEEVLSARRVANNRRITVYASRADKALAASRALHGYPRLGSPYCFNPFEAADLKAKGLPERCYRVAPRADRDRHHRRVARVDGAQQFPAQRGRMPGLYRRRREQAHAARAHRDAMGACIPPRSRSRGAEGRRRCDLSPDARGRTSRIAP